MGCTDGCGGLLSRGLGAQRFGERPAEHDVGVLRRARQVSERNWGTVPERSAGARACAPLGGRVSGVCAHMREQRGFAAGPAPAPAPAPTLPVALPCAHARAPGPSSYQESG